MRRSHLCITDLFIHNRPSLRTVGSHRNYPQRSHHQKTSWFYSMNPSTHHSYGPFLWNIAASCTEWKNRTESVIAEVLPRRTCAGSGAGWNPQNRPSDREWNPTILVVNYPPNWSMQNNKIQQEPLFDVFWEQLLSYYSDLAFHEKECICEQPNRS